MADELPDRVDQVLAEEIASRGGGFAGPWVLMGQYTDHNGIPSWMFYTADGQYLYDTIALAEWLHGMMTHAQHRYWENNGGVYDPNG